MTSIAIPSSLFELRRVASSVETGRFPLDYARIEQVGGELLAVATNGRGVVEACINARGPRRDAGPILVPLQRVRRTLRRQVGTVRWVRSRVMLHDDRIAVVLGESARHCWDAPRGDLPDTIDTMFDGFTPRRSGEMQMSRYLGDAIRAGTLAVRGFSATVQVGEFVMPGTDAVPIHAARIFGRGDDGTFRGIVCGVALGERRIYEHFVPTFRRGGDS